MSVFAERICTIECDVCFDNWDSGWIYGMENKEYVIAEANAEGWIVSKNGKHAYCPKHQDNPTAQRVLRRLEREESTR